MYPLHFRHPREHERKKDGTNIEKGLEVTDLLLERYLYKTCAKQNIFGKPEIALV